MLEFLKCGRLTFRMAGELKSNSAAAQGSGSVLYGFGKCEMGQGDDERWLNLTVNIYFFTLRPNLIYRFIIIKCLFLHPRHLWTPSAYFLINCFDFYLQLSLFANFGFRIIACLVIPRIWPRSSVLPRTPVGDPAAIRVPSERFIVYGKIICVIVIINILLSV